MKSKRAIFLRKFGMIVGYGVLFCLLSAAVYWLVMWTFTIKNIVVIGNTIKLQVNEAKLPKTLLLFPSAAIRSQLLNDNPILADIQFQKKYPHTLMIIPTLRTAVARLMLTERDVFVDESAIVLSDADASWPELPHLVVPLQAVRIGETIRDRRVTAGILFITGTRNFLPIRSISVEDEQSLRATSDTLDILFPQEGSMQAIVTTLQTLLAGFRIKGTLPTFIDLRFNKPIVKF